MSTAANPANALRRAALLLHALSPQDQAWVLASLSPRRRERLQALLGELRDLGIPAEACPFPREDETPAMEAPADAMERLQHLTPEQLAWLACQLQDEPPQVAAMLLSHLEVPWRAALVVRLDAVRQRCVEAAAHGPRRPMPQAALLEAMVRMLPVASLPPRLPVAQRLWARLRSGVARGVPVA